MRQAIARIGDVLRAGPSSRSLSTSAVRENYPFSNRAVFPASTLSSPEIPANLISPKNGWSVVTHQNEALKKAYDGAGVLKTLFARRSAQRIKTGSVLSVISYSNPAKTGVTPFSGVLMGVKRRGVDTSFTLRNVVQRTGVEMNFKVCSPMIKEIKVIRRAEGRKSGIRDLRRAKATYLRDRPGVMSQIAGALKASTRS
ncbi:54S ribosomal protein subunit img1, mitochondrial [Vanrija pseudolonga]|uniref:54S ribosomal protein subunit img1, mitochondrial n=1 Tax=Vanrija pseudolonga TaxID=143232 RepID=A0AAF0YEE3_9TREE|nr:54S ribosomal protein subunit img1, mitochondrial [Vanrija pseudolonga]